MQNKMSFPVIIATFVAFTVMAIAQSTDESTKGINVDGSALYRLHCASCHGIDQKDHTQQYPALIGVNNRLSRDKIRETIVSGRGNMPSFSHLSEDERSSIIAFLLTEEAPTIQISSAELGEKIFVSNCSSCHGVTPSNAAIPKMCKMVPAPLAVTAKRLSKAEFLRILETGVCYMPSFEHFSALETDALFSYVFSLKEEENPSISSVTGRMCTMTSKAGRCN